MTENKKENLFVLTALQGGLLDGGPFFGPKIRLIRQPKGPNCPLCGGWGVVGIKKDGTQKVKNPAPVPKIWTHWDTVKKCLFDGLWNCLFERVFVFS